MQKLMRNERKKFSWTDATQVSFEHIKREFCEAPVLVMPTEKGMFASVVAISGILHQEQEWNGRTVLRSIAYGSKVVSDTEMNYGAPKVGSAPFKFRVDSCSCLAEDLLDDPKLNWSLDRADGRLSHDLGHRTRDKHQNADSLSKKTEFYERLEEKQANQAEIKDVF